MQLKVHASINDTGSKLTTSVVDTTVANLTGVADTGVKIFPWIYCTLIVMMPAANCRQS
jgi:hypothetical protein